MASRRTVILVLFFLFFALALTALAQQKTKMQAKLTPDEARSIAKEVFLWGMHPVAIYHQRYNFAQNGWSKISLNLSRRRAVQHNMVNSLILLNK